MTITISSAFDAGNIRVAKQDGEGLVADRGSRAMKANPNLIVLYVAAVVVAGAVTALATPLVRRLASHVGMLDQTGMPSREELVEHYATLSGLPVDHLDYYIVLAKWKLAVVLEQGFQRAGDDEKLNAFGPIVLELMQGAADLAATTDYRG